MRNRATGGLRLLAKPALALAVVLPHYAGMAQNENKHQTVYLPDPTPRETDPHLIYGEKPTAAQTQAAVEARNAQRRALVLWGANELVKLSQQLNDDLAKKAEESPRAPMAADAEKIETLAKNLKMAVKAQ